MRALPPPTSFQYKQRQSKKKKHLRIGQLSGRNKERDPVWIPTALCPRTCELFSLRCANALLVSFCLLLRGEIYPWKTIAGTDVEEINKEYQIFRRLQVPFSPLRSVFVCQFLVHSVFTISAQSWQVCEER